MKKLISITLVLALLLAGAAAFADGEDIRVYLDGKLLELKDANGDTVTPIVIDGTTYLPVRAIADNLGLGVVWNEGTRSVHLSGEDKEIVVTDGTAFADLSYYLNRPYDILGTEAFQSAVKEVMGDDYSELEPLFATTYASGDSDILSLHCSDSAVVDVHKNGRVDVAVLSPKDDGFGGQNTVKYYSDEMPDAVDSKSVQEFIKQNVLLSGYTAVKFVNGAGTPSDVSGKYSDVEGFGSFSFSKNENGSFGFGGKIEKSPRGTCTTSGTLVLQNGCTVCMDNGNPSILFAFSGKSLTVIGLDNVPKALTTVFTK